MVDLLSPAHDSLAEPYLSFLAARLPAVTEEDPVGLAALPKAMVVELLSSPCLVRCTVVLFAKHLSTSML